MKKSYIIFIACCVLALSLIAGAYAHNANNDDTAELYNTGNVVEIRVIPNPIISKANISLDIKNADKAVLKVTDNNGRVVWQKDAYLVQGINSIDVQAESWPRGLYYLHVFFNNDQRTAHAAIEKM